MQYIKNKSIIGAILLLFILPIHLYSQNNEEGTSFKHHELRLGIDDPFVTLFIEGGCSPGAYITYNDVYTGRIFIEYQYHFNQWISTGAQFGWSGYFFDELYLSDLPSKRHTMEFTLMPKVKCTYFHSKWVELYAAGAFGLCYNISNAYGEHYSSFQFTTQVTLFGLAVGNGQWFGAFEIAPAINFGNGSGVMPMSLFNISVSCRF